MPNPSGQDAETIFHDGPRRRVTALRWGRHSGGTPARYSQLARAFPASTSAIARFHKRYGLFGPRVNPTACRRNK